MWGYLQRVVICCLSLAPLSASGDEKRTLDTGKIVDHMLRLERVVSKHTEDEVQYLKGKIGSAYSTSFKNSKRLEQVAENLAKESLKINNLTILTGGMAGSVAFEVRQKSPLLTVGDQEIIKFDEVTLNKGDAYNSKTGMFIAPVSGTYLFWANIMSENSGDFRVQLFKEGTVIVNGYTSRTVTHGNAPLIYITKVDKGQHVWLGNWEHKAKTMILGGMYSNFGGMLLTVI